MQENFLQKENLNYIINQFGKELWIQVYGKRDMNGADGYFCAGLIPNDKIGVALQEANWEHHNMCQSPGFFKSGNTPPQYDRFSGSEYEPLIYVRDFYGVKSSYVEISEEFRLLNNLYFDNKLNQYMEISDSGNIEPVIKVEGNNVFIKLNYLKRFAAVKKMGVALYFDIRFDSIKTLEEMECEPIDEKQCGSDYCFNYYVDNDEYVLTDRKSYCVINGKKILFGMDIEECGYWPFDKSKEYVNFTVGINGDGKEVEFTSNPNQLANYFGANPEAPHYLTPIYFSKEVLAKYYLKPELYEVNDGHIRCQGLWMLHIDNLNKGDYVSAYLGDLGKLPYKEQVYWKSFNIVSDGRLSDAKFKRDFLAEFADAEIADVKFKQNFIEFKRKWHQSLKWDLFLELSEGDKYNFEHLRIPISNSQVEFDGLVLSLVKTIIDSLNEKELKNQISEKELKGSIKILEKFFEEQGIVNFESHIKFLRNLQELRSAGTGHRKGKNYDKVCRKFNLEAGNFAEVFEKILENAIELIEFLEETFISKSAIEKI